MEAAGALQLTVADAEISAVSVKLRGLPFKALEQDISDFFNGYNVQRALLKRYPDGRPNGEVLCVILSTAINMRWICQQQQSLISSIHCRMTYGKCTTSWLVELLQAAFQ